MSDTQAAATTAVETPNIATEPKPAPKEDQEPSWLAARLERERRTVLKGLGVESVDDAKTAIDELKKRQAAEKTETERLRGEVESLKVRDARAKQLEAIVATRAEAEMKSLTAAQREAVMKLAGDDPSSQLNAVETLRATWVAPPPAAIATPASTAPNAPAPKPTIADAENKLATWEALQKSNPMAAAHYLVAHQLEISEARQARR